jgi:Anthranilate phosphoribosyltransferase
VVGGAAQDLREGVERAREAIDNGRAADVLEDLIDLSRKLASEAR